MQNNVRKKILSAFVFIGLITITLSVLGKKVSAANNYEIEDNNLKSTATSIGTNDTYTGQISYSSDVDYYAFDLLEDGYFNIDFGITSIDTEKVEHGWDVDIYNDNVLVYSIKNITNKTRSTNLAFTKGSKIYIKIAPNITYDVFCPINIEYNISANYVLSNFWEQENNDSKSTSNKISINTDYIGNIQRKDDVYADEDYYEFKTTEDGYFSIDFSPASIDTEDVQLGWNIDIFNNETLIYTGSTLKNLKTPNFAFSKNTQIYVKISPSNTYYMFVPNGIDYKIKANFKKSSNWEKEFNNSKKKANSIAIGKKTFGNLLSSSDEDYLKFKASKTGTIKLSFGASNIDDEDLKNGWNITVTINNKNVYSGTQITQAYKALKSFKVKKGNLVYIKVTPNNTYPSFCPTNIDYAVNVKYK